MPTLQALGGDRLPNSARLSTTQAGNGASTNVVDRGAAVERGGFLAITTVVGATPTCTYVIEGSADGTTWYPVSYADPATPDTWTVAPFTLTTAGTTLRFLRPNQPWRFLRVVYSANTNVTNTADAVIF